jgi:zinc protease
MTMMTRLRHSIAATIAGLGLMLAPALSTEATAMKIQQVKSPGGIEAWLVEEHSVPLIALRFSVEGGSAQDAVGKEGVANFMTAMLDEGAGDLTAVKFQERMEELAMRMGFEDGRDQFYGSFETLTVNKDAALDLFRLAINKPRFEASAVDRIRAQLLSSLKFAEKDPNNVAGKAWTAAAFPNHPYGRSAKGTDASVNAIKRDDLEAYRRRVFAKDNLKVVVVGDIDAATLGPVLDKVFGEFAAKAQLQKIEKIEKLAIKTGGQQRVIEMNVPQSVATFGSTGMLRRDPDFMAATVMNQILGGGGFASRLMEEVREKRGLAYSVSSYLNPMRNAGIFAGGVATKNEEMGQSLDVIRAEFKRMADTGPTQTEFKNAKSFMLGSYALRFDTNAKIASQLLGIAVEDLGIDYVDKRNKEVEAVTLEDVKRAARRLLANDDLLITIVGKPKGVVNRG